MNCEVYNPQTIIFVGGSTQYFDIDLFSIVGAKVIPALNSITWSLAKYGDNEIIDKKVWTINENMSDSGITLTDNTITIKYLSKDIYGKFHHQIQIVDSNNKRFIMDLGNIIIKRGLSIEN